MPMPKHSRIIRVSEEVRITLERVTSNSDESEAAVVNAGPCPACSNVLPWYYVSASEEIPKETHFGAGPGISQGYRNLIS